VAPDVNTLHTHHDEDDQNVVVATWPIEAKLFGFMLHDIMGQSDREMPKILHVETDWDLSQMLSMALHDHADLIVAPTLEDASIMLEEEKFDLVLLDVEMPDGSGLSLMPKFDALELPVVVLSANEDISAIEGRASDVFIKSKTPEAEIVKGVLKALEKGYPGTIDKNKATGTLG
jgi:DNA-binding NtrC family response regulator